MTRKIDIEVAALMSMIGASPISAHRITPSDEPPRVSSMSSKDSSHVQGSKELPLTQLSQAPGGKRLRGVTAVTILRSPLPRVRWYS